MTVSIPEIAGFSVLNVVVALVALLIVWQLVVLVWAAVEKNRANNNIPYWKR